MQMGKKALLSIKNNNRGSAQNWQENLGTMHGRKLTQTEETKLTQGQKQERRGKMKQNMSYRKTCRHVTVNNRQSDKETDEEITINSLGIDYKIRQGRESNTDEKR